MVRTDDDTWNLAFSVGATATMVAAGRARASRAGVIDDPFAEPLVRAVGIDFFTRWACGQSDTATVDFPDAPWGMQRMTDQQAARTRHIDDFFAVSQEAGIRQAVILASGLDARGYRLPWATNTTVFEIDVPQVLGFKTTTLAALGATPTADVRAVPIDLRHDWPTALRAAGFDVTRPTAWAAEGLFGYLPPEGQDLLLDNVSALSTAGSRLVAEVFFSAPASRELYDAIFARWYEHGLDVEMDRLGFPGERSDVATYLARHGWCVSRTLLNELLVANGLRPHAVGRCADETMFTENYYCTAVLSSGRPD